MRIISLPTGYYQQFDADYSKEVPALGYGGWKKADLDLNLDKCAFVLMHATDYGTMEEVPGVFRACEFIPRAYEIGEKVMPKLLETVRKNKIKLFHVAAGSSYCKDYPGYKKVVDMFGEEMVLEQVEQDEVTTKLRNFKRDHCFPGKHNMPSYEILSKNSKFPKGEEPLENEEIVTNERQLLKLCQHYGINHLIYIGYNINWCIQFSNGGFMHLFRHAIMCSTVREAVSAVENKESAANNMGKEIALWTIAVGFGFVYDLKDLLEALK